MAVSDKPPKKKMANEIEIEKFAVAVSLDKQAGIDIQLTRAPYTPSMAMVQGEKLAVLFYERLPYLTLARMMRDLNKLMLRK